MKSFTDVSQSKKLAEILPTESADMARCGGENVIMTDYMSAKKKFSVCGELTITPCWSLAALLDVLPYPEIWQDHSTNRWACSSLIKDTEYLWESENLVDSCVEVIIKLHKQKLL